MKKNTLNKRFNGAYGEAGCTRVMIVPTNYIFENHIDSFIANPDSKVKIHGNCISDKNFQNVSKRMSPGEIYHVEIVPIIQYIVHCRHCVNDLKKQKNLVFLGIQGLALFKQQYPNALSEGKTLSFDEKENLFYDGYSQQVPYMHRSDRITEFGTINFWSSLPSVQHYLLLFFIDEKTKDK